jgi:maleate cis-trans isomerase
MMPNARVGIIIPSSNRMVEQEMVRWFPADVQAHVNRLRMTGVHAGPLTQLLPRVQDAAAALADAKCDAIAFHCTATSMEEGADGEERIFSALQAGAHDRVTTTARSIARAFDSLGIKRLVLVTPYTQAVTEHEAEYLEHAGYSVVHLVAANRGGSDGYCSTPSSFWHDTVLDAARSDADGYLVSCANIACFDQIERLESALGKPVVTSNQAVVWNLLRLTGTTAPPRLGRLFDALAPA